MNPISLSLNLLLAVMLGLTLLVGWRLNRRLTALKDSQAQFVVAVAELDRAAARAERGLADLRAAGDETLELLSGRVEKGRELAARLERLNDAARTTLDRAPAPQLALVPAAVNATMPSALAALQKVWAPAPAPEPSLEEAEAAAESLVLKLSKAEALDDGRVAQFPPRSTARSRTIVDDDLFETPARPAPRILAGDR